jgi:hypothetical protein
MLRKRPRVCRALRKVVFFFGKAAAESPETKSLNLQHSLVDNNGDCDVFTLVLSHQT